MYTEVMGIKTHYIVCKNDAEYTKSGSELNEEKDVLLLHGWGCDCEVYRAVTNRLSKKYNVFVPELPGFGNTEEPPSAWGVAEYADFTAEFVKQCNLKRFIIFAHSLGGRITAKLFTNHKDLCKDVTRVVITGGAGVKPKRTLKSKMRTFFYKAAKTLLNFKPVKNLFPGAIENLRKKNGSADYLSASPRMRECLVRIVNEDLTNLFGNIDKETLLIWGDNDDQTPLSDGQLLEQIIPNAGLAVMKNAGHYAFLENTELFCRILDAFIR